MHWHFFQHSFYQIFYNIYSRNHVTTIASGVDEVLGYDTASLGVWLPSILRPYAVALKCQETKYLLTQFHIPQEVMSYCRKQTFIRLELDRYFQPILMLTLWYLSSTQFIFNTEPIKIQKANITHSGTDLMWS